MSFTFSLEATAGRARAGVFKTPHGDILTPVFAPVGTQATVKAILPRDLHDLNATLVLANTYHLHLRPGDDLVAEMGGLHRFMAWDGPMLTDSGGFQVFSLAELRRIDDNGVRFRSHLDGASYYLTPEKSMAIQHNLGADIIMAFDECAVPNDRPIVEAAMHRTHAWAKRCVEYHMTQGDPTHQALFGIVQGGIFPDLRAQSVEAITSLNLPGYAIGGLAVGETKKEMLTTLDATLPLMPTGRPRYLMGVGRAEDLVQGIARGIDIFDCVLPTREARHGAALTRFGRYNMRNQQFAHDPEPIEVGCECYACQHFSRAYIRHLIKAKELIAHQLLSIHNLHFLLKLVRDMRATIVKGESEFRTFADAFLTDWHSGAGEEVVEEARRSLGAINLSG
ncbi:MAG: tRNA guanosine(34) transglycosylase Tgt [Chloroflexi bacterium]|nr:tRNA guanosine(34) transglycosylase Tgt [Chloroflexota bacterium]